MRRKLKGALWLLILLVGGVSAQTGEPKFGMEFEFAGNGDRIVRFEEMPFRNYERIMRVIVEHFGGDANTIRRVDFTKPTTLPAYPNGQRPLFKAQWDDPRGRTWTIEPEYVASRGLDGYELVTPVLEDTRDLERILERLHASGLVREGAKSGVHLTVDAAGLVGPNGDARALRNLILMHENIEPLLRRMFNPVREGGHSNRFARSLAVDHPELLREISELKPSETTIERMAEVFAKYDVREAEIQGSKIGETSQSKMWKYRSLNLAKVLQINSQHDAKIRVVEFRMLDLGDARAHRLHARFYRRLVSHALELAARGEAVRYRPRASMPVGENPTVYNTPEDPREAKQEARELIRQIGLDPAEFSELLEETIRQRESATRAEVTGLVEALSGEANSGTSEFRYRFEVRGRGPGLASFLRPLDARIATPWELLTDTAKRAEFERMVGNKPSSVAEHFTVDTSLNPQLRGLRVDSAGFWVLESVEFKTVAEAEQVLGETKSRAGRSAQDLKLFVKDTAPKWGQLEFNRMQVEGFFRRATRWLSIERVSTLRPGRAFHPEAAQRSEARPGAAASTLETSGARISKFGQATTQGHVEVEIRAPLSAQTQVTTLAQIVTHQLRANEWGAFQTPPAEQTRRQVVEEYSRYVVEVEGQVMTPARRRIIEALQRGALGNSPEAITAPLMAWAEQPGLPETTQRAVRFAQEEYLSWLHKKVQAIESGLYGTDLRYASEEGLRDRLELSRSEARALLTSEAALSGTLNISKFMKALAVSQILSQADLQKLHRLNGVDLAQANQANLQQRLGITAEQASAVLSARNAHTLEIALELAKVPADRRALLRRRAAGLDLGSRSTGVLAIMDYTNLPAGVARQIVLFREGGRAYGSEALQEAGFNASERAALRRVSSLPINNGWSLAKLLRDGGLPLEQARDLLSLRDGRPYTSFKDVVERVGLSAAAESRVRSAFSLQELNTLSATEISARNGILTPDEVSRLVNFRTPHNLSHAGALRIVLNSMETRNLHLRFGALDLSIAPREALIEKGLDSQLVERFMQFRDAHPLGRLTRAGTYDARLAASTLLEAGVIGSSQVEAVLQTQAIDLERASVDQLRKLGLDPYQAERVVRLRETRELSVASLQARGFDTALASTIVESLQALSLESKLEDVVRRTQISPEAAEALRKLRRVSFETLIPTELREVGFTEAQIERLQAVSDQLRGAGVDQRKLKLEIGTKVRSWFAASGLSDGLLRSLVQPKPASASTAQPAERAETKLEAKPAEVTEAKPAEVTEPKPAEVTEVKPLEPKPAETKPAAPSSAEVASAVDRLAAWRKSDGRVDWSRFAKEKTRVEALGLAHFGLGLFLKELAVAVNTGDRIYVEEFFDALLTTDFYQEYGLFVAGARMGEVAYTRYLQRHVKHKFVNSVLKTNLVLATGLALPAIVHGRFEGKAFAISLGSLGLSSGLVHGGTKGLKWVVDLRKARATGSAARSGLALKRLARAGAWFYSAAELAVILYVAEDLEKAVNGYLDRAAAEKAIGSAGEAFLSAAKDPAATPESITAAAEAYDAAWTTYRDFLYSPLFAAEAQVAHRMEGLAETAKELDDKRKEAVERVKRFGGLHERTVRDYGSLEGYVRHLVAADEAKLSTQVNRILSSYNRERSEGLSTIYDSNRRTGRYLEGITSDLVRGSTRSVVWRTPLRSRVSGNRLQAYEDELEVFSLAEELLSGAARNALTAYARRVEATRGADDQLAHGENGVVNATAARAGVKDLLEVR